MTAFAPHWDISESFADRAATREQLAAAFSIALKVNEAAMFGEPWALFTEAVELACDENIAVVAEIVASARLDPALHDPSPADRRFARREVKAQAELIRDLFGNPFRPITLDTAHRTPTIVSLARSAYDERQLSSGELDPHRLAVLADALEEAGAPTELVAHLSGRGPHVRGCHVVDLCLKLK